MKDLKYTIYSISDPFTNEVFYVGQSANYDNRQRQHLYKCHNKAARSRIDDILTERGLPIFTVLEHCSKDLANETEEKWIAHFCDLVDGMCNIK